MLFIFIGTDFAISAEKMKIMKKAEMAWVKKNNGKHDITYSYFDGNAWKGSILLSTGNPVNFVPAIANKKNGDTWFVWSSDTGEHYHLYYAVISNDKILAGPVQIKTQLNSNTTPSITIDMEDTPWIAWSGNNGKDDDIYYSKHNGTTWEKEKIVHNENSYPDIFPKVISDQNNSIVVQWTHVEPLKSQKITAYLRNGSNVLKSKDKKDVSSAMNMQNQVSLCLPNVPKTVENLDLAILQLNCDGNQEAIQLKGKSITKYKK